MNHRILAPSHVMDLRGPGPAPRTIPTRSRCPLPSCEEMLAGTAADEHLSAAIQTQWASPATEPSAHYIAAGVAPRAAAAGRVIGSAPGRWQAILHSDREKEKGVLGLARGSMALSGLLRCPELYEGRV